MATTVQKIDKFHDSARGRITFGLIELAIAWLGFIWATDSANMWAYAITILFFVGGLRNLANARFVLSNGKKKKR